MSAGARASSRLRTAMTQLTKRFPPGIDRPEWVTAFVLALGGPSEMLQFCAQADIDAEDAKRWHQTVAPPPPVPGGRSLLQLVAAAQLALSRNLAPDGPADHGTLAELSGLMDCAEQRAAEAQAEQDATDAELWRRAESLLPGSYYMDPPDGGSVSVFEQLQRMAADAELWRASRTACKASR